MKNENSIKPAPTAQPSSLIPAESPRTLPLISAAPAAPQPASFLSPASSPETSSPLAPLAPSPFQRRPYQTELFTRLNHAGLLALLWRRQGGKTTTLAEIAIRKMLKTPGRLVTFASVSILLGREIVLKETQVFLRALAEIRAKTAHSPVKLEVLDSKSNSSLTSGVLSQSSGLNPPSSPPSSDMFAELFEAQRLEFRLYHSNSTYSRTQVIAPNPATARGWTGDVILDEIGFIDDLPCLWEAMEPIVSTDPDFRVIMATTPPPDDSHFSFDLLAPPTPMEFSPNPKGNWYRSQAGILVHRCDIYDAHAAGVPIYDLETRQPLTPDEHLANAIDKDAWRRNYALQFLPGGAAAITLASIGHAQEAGLHQCHFQILDDLGRGQVAPACARVEGGRLVPPFTPDLDPSQVAPAPTSGLAQGQPATAQFSLQPLSFSLAFLNSHLGSGLVGLGYDPATTEKSTSNPSALAVLEKLGPRFAARLILVWKTADPDYSQSIITAILDAIAARPEGGHARRLCIDATNERYFATILKQNLGGRINVDLVIGSETTLVPGQRQPITLKSFLGHKLIELLEDNLLLLPPDRYIKDDFRLVRKNKGTFENETSPHGQHADTFDACKLAYRALTTRIPGPVAFVL